METLKLSGAISFAQLEEDGLTVGDLVYGSYRCEDNIHTGSLAGDIFNN
jgi:hypothetical protein